MTGTPIRKTDPHHQESSSTPPMTGPTAMPTESAVTQVAMAVARCRSSLNMWMISESVDGSTAAPATPSSARATISISGLVAYAASSEETITPSEPRIRSLRRPIRSPRVPMTTRNPQVRNP